MSELPKGWTYAAIADLCQLNPGKPSRSGLSPDDEVSFVPMAAVDADEGAIVSPTTRPYSAVSKGYTAFQDGDVIMAKITPCMENGKAAVARGLVNGLGFGSTEFHVFRSNGASLPDYLFQFIRKPSAKSRRCRRPGRRW